MEDFDSSVQLKEKLLIAGIDEILAHGINDFSLRRVAAACGASCAAPYKHFKNKEEFIEAIISYVEKRWALLAAQIAKSIDDDRQRIAELAIANVRFKIANPLYGQGKHGHDKIIFNEVNNFCIKNNIENSQEMQFGIAALVTGTAALMEAGKLGNTPETFAILRKKILAELA